MNEVYEDRVCEALARCETVAAEATVVVEQVIAERAEQHGRLMRFLEDVQVGVDLAAIAAGTVRTPHAGDELTVDEIPCVSYIRVAGEDVLYLGHRQGVMDLMDDSGGRTQYPSGDGETFVYVGDLV